jgi:thiosulfate/3-mercaptopyruvate sulfurtransferase
MRPALPLFIMVLVASLSQGGQDSYPRPDLLIEPVSLSRPQVARQFVILDARDQKSFNVGRIPQARWVDAAAWATTFSDGKDSEGWGKSIGQLGIEPNSKVVIYDAVSTKDAARIWWILRYWGVKDVRLLNGGWKGWQSAMLPVEKNKPRPPTTANFAAVPLAKRLVTKQQLLSALKNNPLQIVDARSEKEFCGLDPMENKRAGAIPGAKHLEWSDLIHKETQRFKSPAELRKLFREAGIDLTKSTAAHCQSGGRASVMVFGMELMGADDVGNYYASWAEWGNAEDTPIVTGKATKKE